MPTIEKDSLPGPIRMLLSGLILVFAGVLVDSGHYYWFVLFLVFGFTLLMFNVANYLLSDNYRIGYADGHKEGCRVSHGLMLAEDDLLSGNYEVFASAILEAGGYAVVISDLNMSNAAPRVFHMDKVPPPIFRRELVRNEEDPNPGASKVFYAPIKRPA